MEMAAQGLEKSRMAEDRFRIIRRYIVFLTTGRSGSSFVADLVNKNAINASSEHEPDLVPVDASTRWYYDGENDRLATLVEKKIARLRRGEIVSSIPFADRFYTSFARSKVKRLIPRVPLREIYVEVDNGFLKSYGHHLLNAIPDLWFVHLTRDPLLQAKSAENRQTQPNPKRPYYLWPTWERNVLPLSEDVAARLSKFQLALWYWIEMELRYVEFVRLRLVRPVMDLDVDELNDEAKVEALFRLLGIRHRPLNLKANRNLGPRQSLITDQEHAETRALLDLIPDEALRRLPNTYGLEHF